MTLERCYLCGRALRRSKRSSDHAVPRVLLDGQPPKVRGFDYGGLLPTHKTCNNRFGPETYAQRALELISALHDPNCVHTFRHRDEPGVRLMALNAACLPNFDARARRYFRIMDRSGHPARPVPRLAELSDRTPVDPYKQSLHTALAVLLKSAAALLIRKRLRALPGAWQVMAVPFVGEAHAVDFDDLLGPTRPFSKHVKAWCGIFTTGDALVIYRARGVLVYFFFRFSAQMEGWRHMRGQFVDYPRLRFDGNCIRDVLSHGWKRV
jgi:hypothetical protein